MADKSAPERVDPDEIDEVDRGGRADSLGQRIDRYAELAEDLEDGSAAHGKAARRFEEADGPRPENPPTEQRP